MKSQILFFMAIFCSLDTHCQWEKQVSNVTGEGKNIHDFSIVDENTVWAPVSQQPSGNPNQEFVKTINGGITWELFNIDIAAGHCFSNLFALDVNKAWAAMFNVAGGGHIYKTTNGGYTWTVSDSSLFEGGFPDFIYFFNENDGICVGDPKGGYFEIYTTQNGGDDWGRVSTENIPAPYDQEGMYVNVYEVVNDTIWFGTTKGRLFKSTDRGAHWEVFELFPDVPILSIAFRDGFHGLVIAFVFGSIMYFNNEGYSIRQIESGGYWTNSGPSFRYVHSDGVSPGMYIAGAITHNQASITFDDGANWTIIDTLSHYSFGFLNSSVGWTGACSKNEGKADIYRYTGIPTSIEPKRSSSENVLNLFPNPCNKVLQIKSERSHDLISVYSMEGILLKQIHSVGRQTEIDVTDLTSGVYLIKVNDGISVSIDKFLKE